MGFVCGLPAWMMGGGGGRTGYGLESRLSVLYEEKLRGFLRSRLGCCIRRCLCEIPPLYCVSSAIVSFQPGPLHCISGKFHTCSFVAIEMTYSSFALFPTSVANWKRARERLDPFRQKRSYMYSFSVQIIFRLGHTLHYSSPLTAILSRKSYSNWAWSLVARPSQVSPLLSKQTC